MQSSVLYEPPESAYTCADVFPNLVPTEGSARPSPPARHTATPALFSPSERAERRFAKWCERRVKFIAGKMLARPVALRSRADPSA